MAQQPYVKQERYGKSAKNAINTNPIIEFENKQSLRCLPIFDFNYFKL